MNLGSPQDKWAGNVRCGTCKLRARRFQQKHKDYWQEKTAIHVHHHSLACNVLLFFFVVSEATLYCIIMTICTEIISLFLNIFLKNDGFHLTSHLSPFSCKKSPKSRLFADYSDLVPDQSPAIWLVADLSQTKCKNYRRSYVI